MGEGTGQGQVSLFLHEVQLFVRRRTARLKREASRGNFGRPQYVRLTANTLTAMLRSSIG